MHISIRLPECFVIRRTLRRSQAVTASRCTWALLKGLSLVTILSGIPSSAIRSSISGLPIRDIGTRPNVLFHPLAQLCGAAALGTAKLASIEIKHSLDECVLRRFVSLRFGFCFDVGENWFAQLPGFVKPNSVTDTLSPSGICPEWKPHTPT